MTFLNYVKTIEKFLSANPDLAKLELAVSIGEENNFSYLGGVTPIAIIDDQWQDNEPVTHIAIDSFLSQTLSDFASYLRKQLKENPNWAKLPVAKPLDECDGFMSDDLLPPYACHWCLNELKENKKSSKPNFVVIA